MSVDPSAIRLPITEAEDDVAIFRRPLWQSLAACRAGSADLTPDDWHPARAGHGVGHLREVCSRCPVRLACLSFSLAHPEVQGVWGGTTVRERRALRAARNRRNGGPSNAKPRRRTRQP